MDPVSWLILRFFNAIRFLVNDLGLPIWLAAAIIGVLIFLFFYALYDIYQNKDKGNAAFIWLMVVIIVPFSGIVYAIFGHRHLSQLPVVKPAPPPPPQSAPNQASSSSEALSYNQTQYNLAAAEQKKYFLGATTALGGAVAIIGMIAGVTMLVFFVFIIISIIQCMNDPKCM